VKTKSKSALVLLSVSALLLAGCAEPRPDAAETPTPEAKVFVTAPLTGLTVEQGTAGSETFSLHRLPARSTTLKLQDHSSTSTRPTSSLLRWSNLV
jgi:hypothetical protein